MQAVATASIPFPYLLLTATSVFRSKLFLGCLTILEGSFLFFIPTSFLAISWSFSGYLTIYRRWTNPSHQTFLQASLKAQYGVRSFTIFDQLKSSHWGTRLSAWPHRHTFLPPVLARDYLSESWPNLLDLLTSKNHPQYPAPMNGGHLRRNFIWKAAVFWAISISTRIFWTSRWVLWLVSFQCSLQLWGCWKPWGTSFEQLGCPRSPML